MWASHDSPPNVGDSTNAETLARPVAPIGLAERPPGGVERFGKLGTVERDGAVRLHEQQDDVGSLHAREIGVHRRAGRDGAAAAQGIDGEPRLPPVGRADGRREPPQVRVEVARVLGGEQRRHRDGQGAQHEPRGGHLDGLDHPGDRPPDRQVKQPDSHRRTEDGRRDQPPWHRARKHRRDVRDEAQVPVEVDVAAVERLRRDIAVPSEHEDEPHDRHPPDGAPRGQRHSAKRRRGAQQQCDRQLDRQFARPAHRGRGPEALEGQRRVEDEKSGREACNRHNHRISTRNDHARAASAAAAMALDAAGSIDGSRATMSATT